MLPQGGILCLDLSLTVGWAYGLSDQSVKPIGGVWRLPRTKAKDGSGQMGLIFSSLMNCLDTAIDLHLPEMIVYEAPLLLADKVDRLLKNLAAMVELAAYEADKLPCREVTVGNARQLVIGRRSFREPFRGQGVIKTVRKRIPRKPGAPRDAVATKRLVGDPKEEVMIWAKSQGYDPVDDNHADALLLLKYACVMAKVLKS